MNICHREEQTLGRVGSLALLCLPGANREAAASLRSCELGRACGSVPTSHGKLVLTTAVAAATLSLAITVPLGYVYTFHV